MELQNEKTEKILRKIFTIRPSLSFSIFEIGSRPVESHAEPFHALVDFFPESRLYSFETDKDLCAKLNRNGKPNVKHFPVALGKTEADLPFYETVHPMCCSLYEPNEEFLKRYNGLEVAMLKKTGCIHTTSLDAFAESEQITDADFLKIDVQGAELDIFKGGEKILESCVFIVSEVEFVPLYIDQPLFGDVCSYLTTRNLMFHRFLGLWGRALRPITMNNDPYFPSQHMWSDAVFIRNIVQLPKLPPDKLLKMGILTYLYGSLDVAYTCFQQFDQKENTKIAQEILAP